MRSADARRRGLGGLLLACLLASAQALALDLAGQPVAASLVAERDGIEPGRPFRLAVRLSHQPGWHSYWQLAGDSGLPTRVSWRLPPGFRAGALQWPVPRRLAIGTLVDYGYEGEALLLAGIEPAAGLAPGTAVHVGARVQWLMCRDVCIPASADLDLELAVREATALRPTPYAPAFERAQARVPLPLALAQASATRSGRSIRLEFSAPSELHSLEFFPIEADRIEPSAPQHLSVSGNRVRLDLSAAAPAFTALRGVLVADGGVDAAGGWIGTIEVPLVAAAGPP
jgi:DsbC/DsbD-like thiol-disulfide interchange protein